MARPSKRLVLVLSLCLLLQQFSPAYTAGIKRAVHSKNKHHDIAEKNRIGNNIEFEDDNDTLSKRSFTSIFKSGASKIKTVLKKGWDLLGDADVIKKLNMAAEVADNIADAAGLAITVTKAIQGCEGIAPDLKANWEKYLGMDKEVRDISRSIDNNVLQAESRQIYVNTSFYEYRRTRDKLQEIADEQERTFRSMGVDVVQSLLNATTNMQNLIQEKNKTGEDVDDTTIHRGYEEGLSLGLGVSLPTLNLAVTGLKVFWNLYLKDTMIGQAISGWPEKFKAKLKTSGAGSLESLSKKISSSRIMSTRYGKALQNVGDAIKGKLLIAKGYLKEAKKRLAPFIKFGVAAYSIWSLFKDISDCRQKGEKAKESVTEMTKLVTKMREFQANATEATNEIQTGYDEIRNLTFDQTLLDAVTRVKDMMSDDNIIKQTDTDVQSVKQALQAYIDGKSMDAQDDNQKIALDSLQRNLNSALYRVPFTLSCYTIKVRTFANVKSECSRGAGSMSSVYERVKALEGEDNNNCADRTGNVFPPLEDIKNAWNDWVSANKTYKAICLMNNKLVVEKVKEKMQEGETDAQSIADAVGESDAVDEIQGIIENIQNDPNFNPLSKHLQNTICNLKGQNKSFEEASTQVLTFFPGGDKVTEELYNNQKCPVADNDQGETSKSIDNNNGEDEEEGPSTVG